VEAVFMLCLLKTSLQKKTTPDTREKSLLLAKKPLGKKNYL